MVVDALGDEKAPMYIMRLWSHCQDRRAGEFVMPTRGLKAQCRYDGDAEAFERALVDAGFIEREGDTVRVLGWAEKNASLFAAWENGHKGGRPRKNPNETHGKPTGNPPVTHGEPTENPSLTQTKPIREEKRREEGDKRASALPHDFSPNETGLAKAKEAGVNIDRELAKFRDHHTAKGSKFKDWQAAWRTWVGMAVDFGRGGKPGDDDPYELRRAA
jgi:hypothetical protein